MTPDDISVNYNFDLANLFIQYFSSVESLDYCIKNSSFLTHSTNLFLSNIELTVSEIFESLSNLKPCFILGPNSIPPCTINYCLYSITVLHSISFNLSLPFGQFSKIWKSSFVKLTYKTSNISNVTNYRPISVLSTIAKFFESSIVPKLKILLNNSIIDDQLGFRLRMSTSPNILVFQSFHLNAVECSNRVDELYTYYLFTKSFWYC